MKKLLQRVFTLCAILILLPTVGCDFHTQRADAVGMVGAVDGFTVLYTDTKPVFPNQTQFDAIRNSYHSAQSEPAFEYFQHKSIQRFAAQWVEEATGIKNPQWNFDCFTQYRVLDHDLESVTRKGEKLYYCTFSDGVDRYGCFAFLYDENGPGIQKYSLYETTPDLYDLDACLDDIASNLAKTELDLSTAEASRVSWLDRDNNRSDQIILFADAKGGCYFHYLGDTTFAIHKIDIFNSVVGSSEVHTAE
ncbi:MAG TPA: hypothetical protein DEQ02_07115 [Ruminococcaceae bacterium]|nr:hypothetical protein [Oscillospiraceae bacterium]